MKLQKSNIEGGLPAIVVPGLWLVLVSRWPSCDCPRDSCSSVRKINGSFVGGRFVFLRFVAVEEKG